VLISFNKCNVLFLWTIFILSGTWTDMWSYPYFQLLSLQKLEIQSYCKEGEDPWGHPIMQLVGTHLDLNWLKMWMRRCGHCVVRGMGHNSKTCPEFTRIMVIQMPVLEEPAMEGTSNADPVSSNNSCGWSSRTVICGTCGGNHYSKVSCLNRNLWLPLICSL